MESSGIMESVLRHHEFVADGFHGFGERALFFYEGLTADNSRTYWQRHKDVYERDVLGPLRALGDELADEFGETKIFRPQRDVRFSADKRPYKENAGMVVQDAPRCTWACPSRGCSLRPATTNRRRTSSTASATCRTTRL